MRRNSIHGIPLSRVQLTPAVEAEYSVNALLRDIDDFTSEYLRGLVEFSFVPSFNDYVIRICPARLANFFKEIAIVADERCVPIISAELTDTHLVITVENSESIPVSSDYLLIKYANSAGFSAYGEAGGKIILKAELWKRAPLSVYASTTRRIKRAFYAVFFTEILSVDTTEEN